MIKKKDQLFYLIKSLNKEEKRHFKLFVGKYNGSKDNNYLRLFNAIEKQSVYNEEAIKEQFRNEAFIRQLTVTKYYLQRQIIKSLQNLHYDETKDLEVLVLHHQIAVLFRKGHYEVCRQLVRKGLEICAENELFLAWIGFLKWEIELINKLDFAEYEASLANYLEKTSQLLSWYEITTQGNHLTNQVQIFSLNTPTFGSDSLHYHKLIEKILALINKTNLESLPVKTKFNLYHPLAQSYLIIADYQKAYKIFKAIAEDLADVYQRKGMHEQYLTALSGLIFASGAVNKPDVSIKAIEELKSVPEVNPLISFRKAENLAFFPLISCALKGDFFNGITAIEIVEDFIKNHQDNVNPVQYIFAHYYSAYIFFGNGDHSAAIKYLRKTDEYLSKELLPNIKLGVKIMELIIFYEQHKYDLAESRLRSLQRHLQKEKNVKSFLKRLISFFYKLLALESESEDSMYLLNHFLTDLKQLHANEQALIFIHFDLISWLQSKIENCSFGEKLQLNAARLFASEKFD